MSSKNQNWELHVETALAQRKEGAVIKQHRVIAGFIRGSVEAGAERVRIIFGKEEGLPRFSSGVWQNTGGPDYENLRKEIAIKKGLLETATWEEVEDAVYDELRKEIAIKKGFSETTDLEDIPDLEVVELCKEISTEKGLPAGWTDIIDAIYEKLRKEIAVEKGLLETATWKNIVDSVYKK